MLKRKKVIIDTDPGVDDAFALFYAATHPGFDILGITTTFGNVPTPLAASNARYLLSRFGRKDIPVAEGSHKPYCRPQSICADFVHGKDGLGNTFQANEIGQNDHRPAHVMICDIIRANPGEVTIIAIAPSVNLALALDHDPGIAALVKEVAIMGGAIRANGNINPAAEANVYNDPEAAEKVFHAPWPVTLFPLDVTDRCVMHRDAIKAFCRFGEMGEYFHDISQFYQAFYLNTREDDEGQPINGVVAHDILPVMYVLHPELFTFRTGGIRVVGGEGHLRGHVIMDERTKWSHPHAWSDLPPVKVCFGVDYAALFQAFEDRLDAFTLSRTKATALA